MAGSHIYLTDMSKMISFMVHLTGGLSNQILCDFLMNANSITMQKLGQRGKVCELLCSSLDGASGAKCFLTISHRRFNLWTRQKTIEKIF